MLSSPLETAILTDSGSILMKNVFPDQQICYAYLFVSKRIYLYNHILQNNMNVKVELIDIDKEIIKNKYRPILGYFCISPKKGIFQRYSFEGVEPDRETSS